MKREKKKDEEECVGTVVHERRSMKRGIACMYGLCSWGDRRSELSSNLPSLNLAHYALDTTTPKEGSWFDILLNQHDQYPQAAPP